MRMRVKVGDEEEKLTLHHLMSRDSSLLADVDSAFVDFLTTWSDPDSLEWIVLDAIHYDRGASTEEDRRFVRRQGLVFAAGWHQRAGRRFEAPPMTAHYGWCRKCGTDEERRHEREVIHHKQPCCNGATMDHFNQTFPSLEDLGGVVAETAEELWEEAHVYTTKRSEMEHTIGRRSCGTQKKGVHMTHVCRRGLLRTIRDEHVAGGGEDVTARGCIRVTEQAMLHASPAYGPDVMRKELVGETNYQALCDADPQPAVLDGDGPDHAGEQAIVPAGPPQAEPAEGSRHHGLNPLWQMYNARMHAQRLLLGRPLTFAEMGEIRSASDAIYMHRGGCTWHRGLLKACTRYWSCIG